MRRGLEPGFVVSSGEDHESPSFNCCARTSHRISSSSLRKSLRRFIPTSPSPHGGGGVEMFELIFPFIHHHTHDHLTPLNQYSRLFLIILCEVRAQQLKLGGPRSSKELTGDPGW